MKVSITLMNNDDARPIIQAIERDNIGCEVSHLPSLVKIDSSDSLRINRESVEHFLGREWDVQEIHLTLVSIAGEVDEDDDYFELKWRH
jgi:phenol hydroxylase P2 protein